MPINEYLNRSVSTDTVNPTHLIRAFSDALHDLAPEVYKEHAEYFHPSDWPTPEQESDILEDLFIQLDALAPENYYFGSIEGDGADFGFWQVYE